MTAANDADSHPVHRLIPNPNLAFQIATLYAEPSATRKRGNMAGTKSNKARHLILALNILLLLALGLTYWWGSLSDSLEPFHQAEKNIRPQFLKAAAASTQPWEGKPTTQPADTLP